MSKAWKIILIVAGVVLVIALMTAGFIVPLIGAVVLLIVLAGGALLYRSAGPPER